MTPFTSISPGSKCSQTLDLLVGACDEWLALSLVPDVSEGRLAIFVSKMAYN